MPLCGRRKAGLFGELWVGVMSSSGRILTYYDDDDEYVWKTSCAEHLTFLLDNPESESDLIISRS